MVKYAIEWRDVRTGETGTAPGEPYGIRAAANCRAIALDLQYPHREHAVIEIETEKACGRTESTHTLGRVGGSNEPA